MSSYFIRKPDHIHYSVMDNQHIFFNDSSCKSLIVIPHKPSLSISLAEEDKNSLCVSCVSSKKSSSFRKMLSKIIHFIEDKLFSEQLYLKGVGYRFAFFNEQIQFSCGFSHSVFFPLPAGIFATVSKDQTKIFLFSYDKNLLSLFAAFIRSQKKNDPYKEKGCFSTKNKVSKLYAVR